MPKWGLGRSKDKKKHEKEKESKGAESKNPRKISSASSLSPTHQHIAIYGADNKQHSNSTISSTSGGGIGERDSASPTPSDSSQDLIGKPMPTSSRTLSTTPRRDSGIRVAAHKAFYEDLSLRKASTSPGLKPSSSPEKKKRDFSESSILSSGSNPSISSSKISVSVTSPTSGGNRTPSLPGGGLAHLRGLGDFTSSSSSPSVLRREMDTPGILNMEMGKEKDFEGMDLPLPPLQMTAVRLREVDARRNTQSGGFGFILRKSYLPSSEEPDKTKLVHLIEPRSDYFGPLMTGDRIMEVNGEDVEDAPHEAVVEMIKASGECVNLMVASMPELLELNARGALDNPLERNSGFRKSGRAKQGTGQFFPDILSLSPTCYYIHA